jgi:hypothetical protein
VFFGKMGCPPEWGELADRLRVLSITYVVVEKHTYPRMDNDE